jgi:hypothetical protein
MAGFISGEDCFFIRVNKGLNKAFVGVHAGPWFFQVAQHVRDEELLKNFITYFKCGQYYNPSKKN